MEQYLNFETRLNSTADTNSSASTNATVGTNHGSDRTSNQAPSFVSEVVSDVGEAQPGAPEGPIDYNAGFGRPPVVEPVDFNAGFGPRPHNGGFGVLEEPNFEAPPSPAVSVRVSDFEVIILVSLSIKLTFLF